MKNIAINLIVLRSADLDRASAFYSRLGLVFARHRHGTGTEHCSAEVGGTVFELYPLAHGASSTEGTRIGFTVPSIDTIITALAGIPDCVISPPKQSEWGRRAVIADPDGHRIELLEP